MKKLRIKKLLSFWIAFSISFTSHSQFLLFAAEGEFRKSTAVFPSDLNQVSLPVEIGKIEEVYKGRNKKTVVLIQDAHAIPDAQRSIQKLIEFFQKKYGVNFVGLEGASAQLDFQILKSFPDKEILKKTFEEYSAKGELAGGAAAAIFSEGDEIVFKGVENWDLYEQGLDLYLKSLKKEPLLSEKLAVLKNELQIEKRRVYSPKLLEVDRAVQAFREKKSDLISALKILAGIKRPEKGSEPEESGRIRAHSGGSQKNSRSRAKNAGGPPAFS